MEINFKKKFGQNFLTDTNLLISIAKDSLVNKDTTVLEIGAGAGALTLVLAKTAKKVVSFEIDKELLPVLSQNLKDMDNVELVFGDFLKFTDEQILKKTGADFIVVANLPYYITSPLISRFLSGKLHPKSLTIMVQKEVADRICASPKTKDYGVLSIMVQLVADAKVVRQVSRKMFTPQPNVDSSIVKIDTKKTIQNYEQIVNFVKLCFLARRKTLVNNLSKQYTKQQINQAFAALNISLSTRAEELNPQQFINLYDFLIK